MNFYLRSPDLTLVATEDHLLFGLAHKDSLLKTKYSAKNHDGLKKLVKPVAERDFNKLFDTTTKKFLLENKIIVKGSRSDFLKFFSEVVAKDKKYKRALICVTGSIASFASPTVVLELFQGLVDEIEIIVTSNARQFVTTDLFKHLNFRVWENINHYQNNIAIPHVFLSQSVDFVLIWPATAHIVYKIANGTCSDLISLVTSTTSAPVIIVPAMNENMWHNPSVKKNFQLARENGLYVVEPNIGISLSTWSMMNCSPAINVSNVNKVIENIVELHATKMAKK